MVFYIRMLLHIFGDNHDSNFELVYTRKLKKSSQQPFLLQNVTEKVKKFFLSQIVRNNII